MYICSKEIQGFVDDDGPTYRGGGELEGPQEVVGLLESRSNAVNLMDEILHADDSILAQDLLNDGVVGERDTALVNLAESTLEDELTDSLQVGVTVSHIGLDALEHVESGLVDPEEDTVVDLLETEQLEDLLGLGGNVIETSDADGKDELGLRLYVEATLGLGFALQADQVAFLY